MKLRQRFKPKLTTTTTTTTARPPADADASSDSANEIPDLAANEVSDHQGGEKSFGDKIRHSFSFNTLRKRENIYICACLVCRDLGDDFYEDYRGGELVVEEAEEEMKKSSERGEEEAVTPPPPLLPPAVSSEIR